MYPCANQAPAEHRQRSYEPPVLDVRMGGMDGLELHRRPKAMDPHLAVFFLSAYSDSIQGKPDGVPFLQKPTSLAELSHALAETRNPVSPQASRLNHVQITQVTDGRHHDLCPPDRLFLLRGRRFCPSFQVQADFPEDQRLERPRLRPLVVPGSSPQETGRTHLGPYGAARSHSGPGPGVRGPSPANP